MKTQIKVMVGVGVVTPLLVFGTVFATDATTNTTTSTNDTTSTTQLSPQDKQALQTRLQQRESQLKLKLATADQTRIKAKCKAAQGQITSFNAKLNGVDTRYSQTYGAMIARLSLLADRLQNQGVDVKTYNSQIGTLRTKSDAFNTDFASYKQALDDLTKIDCVSDPTGFQASLQTARADQETLRKDAEDIRSYVTQTIKPTLENLKQSLPASSSTTSGGAH